MDPNSLELANLPDGITVNSVVTQHGRHVYQVHRDGSLLMQFSELQDLFDALRAVRRDG